MNRASILSARDTSILLTVTHKCRIVGVGLLAIAFFQACLYPERQAKRSLERLVRLGLLSKQTLLARPTPNVTQPLITWSPGELEPDLAGLEYLLKKRWSIPTQQTTVYFATTKAKQQFGGCGGRLKKPGQASHDLLVAHIYLQFLAHCPEDAAAWISEDLYADEIGPDDKHGDARLVDSDGNYRLLIEAYGRYQTEHLKTLHPYCSRIGLAYQCW